MLAKQRLAFSKKCKNMSTNQENISDAIFKAWPFSSDFNFACKDSWVTTATCKYYCPLVVYCPIAAKSSILNVAEFLDPSLKMLPCTKASPVLCENQSFFLLFWKVATFIENHCFFLLLFTIWWSIFDHLFRLLLPLSCFLWIQSTLVQSQNY